MPLTVVNQCGGRDGGVGIADAKGRRPADQSESKITGRTLHLTIHNTFAGPPLRAATGSGGFDPASDGKAIADAAENERLEKEKAKADEIAKQKADADKAAAESAEKDRLAKEAEAKALLEKYNSSLAKGDSAFKVKSYDVAKSFYTSAATLKPQETIPADKIKEVDKLITAEKQSQYTNELARKYPQGITEEISKEGNTKVTKRIVVQGNKGNLYIKKETGFGAVYFFKDDVTITETEFIKNTESVK